MSENEEVMMIITRTGKKEPLDTNQIVKRIQTLMNRSPKISHINPYELMLEVCKGLKNDMTTYQIDEYAAQASASLSLKNPHYLTIAARIAIDNHQKNTMRSFVDKMRLAYINDKNPLLSSEFFKYVEQHQDRIEEMIDYNRDFLLDFFGFSTFLKSYSIKINKKPIERPQDMFMRAAIAVNINTENDIENEFVNIRETYNLLSQKYFTFASPLYYNAGGKRPQFASCFLMGTEDSLEGIKKTDTDMAKISKWAGGIGVHINNWRSTGSLIRGTNGYSSGIVPFLKNYETTMTAFNQGGRRPGSAAIYLMPHHPDIVKFVQLRRNGGTEKERARDLFYSLWIPDIFMERIEKNEMWSTFDPDECGDLAQLSGENYKQKYIELEKEKKYKLQISARTLWSEIQETVKETGLPYICFADNANKMFMQSNLGTLKSSNLCSEIYLYSDHKEYAVCILSSISLPNFVQDGYSEEELKLPENERRSLDHAFPKNPYFDFTKMIEVVRVVTRNLNYVVDKTYHPVPETSRSNERHRPIGIGVQGLDDAYSKMRFPFDSDEAKKLNKEIFECLYFSALTESTVSCRKEWQKLRLECKEKGSVTVKNIDLDKDTVKYVDYNYENLPKKVAAYPSMEWNGGSPISKGIFHWELAGLKPEQLSGMFDWESLRVHIKEFGVRNSLLVALMPTASTSQLLGNNECFEPYTSNIYKRDTMAGEFMVIRKTLINDLFNSGLWNNNLKDYLLASEGSIQHIEGIPDEIKRLYKTAWEIDQKELVQQSIDRQPFVDQGQSLNLYVRDFTLKKWTNLMFQGWRGGLKTGKYYLHTEPAVMPVKFTIDPSKQKEMEALIKSTKKGDAFLSPLVEHCESCSA